MLKLLHREATYGESVYVSLSLSLERARGVIGPLALALAAVFLCATAAWAIDCTTGGRTAPYSPSDVEELSRQALVENACCCYNNIIGVVYYHEELIEDEDCCGVFDANCHTSWVVIDRKAFPSASSGLINEWNGDELVVHTISGSMTVDVMCFCNGSAMAWGHNSARKRSILGPPSTTSHAWNAHGKTVSMSSIT